MVSEAVLVVLFIGITREVFGKKKKTVSINKFTIKPSFYVHSNSYIDNNNKNDINIYVSNGRVVQFNLIFRMRNNDISGIKTLMTFLTVLLSPIL